MNELPNGPDTEHSFMNEFQLALIHENNEWDGPLPPLLPNATLLGKADKTLVRLFIMSQRTREEVKRLSSLVEQQDSPEARKKSNARFLAAKARFQAIDKITSIEVGRRFPQLWESNDALMLYLCVGWNVAQVPIGSLGDWAFVIGSPPSS